MDERSSERIQMVKTQIAARGVAHPLVLKAMEDVPRHLFVPELLAREAYSDYPLPIGHGQTISQPYIVAVMTELLDPAPGIRILEIGSGSGYQAAILAACEAEVISMERIPVVAQIAGDNLERAGVKGVTIIIGDGTQGCPARAPYDRILITAAAPSVPEPLKNQLAEGGILVAPVGGREIQEILRITRKGDVFTQERGGAVRFVPLIGRYGWDELAF